MFSDVLSPFDFFPQKAEKAIYETLSLAAAAEMWRSAAELDELLNQVQGQPDRERIRNDWIR